jgi:putative phage-type endonuclease
MLTDEQKKERLLGIGGSDVAAVAGISKYMSPLELYLIKIEETEPDDFTNEAIEWGNELEPIVAAKYAQKMGVEIEKPTKAIVHPEYYWMRCNLDFVVKGTSIVGECKTAGFLGEEWGDESTDQIPPDYLLQCANNAIVSEHLYGTTQVVLPVFSGGRGGLKLRVYNYYRNEKLERRVIDITRKFWKEHVEPRMPPTPTSLKEACIRWPEAQTQPKVATFEVLEVFDELKEIKDKIDSLKDIEDTKKTAICNFLGDEASILLDHRGDKLLTWNNENRSNMDWDEFKKDHPHLPYEKYITRSMNRVFRLSKQKMVV